jgi:hypothetical protein
MAGIVIFLGAGATKSVGGPLTSEILPKILHSKTNDAASFKSSLPQRLDPLEEFLRDLFHVDRNTVGDHYPSLPLLMSLLDTALDRRQSFHPNWEASKVSEVREAVEFGIFDLLEDQLKQVQTTNHYTLVSEMSGIVPEPCIISTNYDLIMDTAMMFFSQTLPDYCCDIRTPFYADAPNKYGRLLKLHGSLNWLYCKTCHRLEIGASASTKWLQALSTFIGPALEQSYAFDGQQCSTCRTRLRPLLIAPTHMKDYRNPHLAQVWYEAERVLREAERVVFIGYSLPDDDVEVVYLLKRSLGNLSADKITVVESGDVASPLGTHPVGRRYRTLFGDDIDWHPEGMDAWLAKQPARLFAR